MRGLSRCSIAAARKVLVASRRWQPLGQTRNPLSSSPWTCTMTATRASQLQLVGDVFLGEVDVAGGEPAHVTQLFIGDGADDFGGDVHDEGAVGDLHARRDDGAG